MQLTWSSLIVIVVAAAVAWFWRDSLRVRELANAAAMDACSQLGLQFLDGTVAFARLRLSRVDGRLNLRRTYVFDYTAHSIDRLQGFVVLHGPQVESVGFARDAAHTTAPPPVSTAIADFNRTQDTFTDAPIDAEQPINNTTNDKVLDLEKWRRIRDSRH